MTADPEAGGPAQQPDDPGWPVGFLVIVGLAALYLAWRFIQMAAAVAGWLT